MRHHTSELSCQRGVALVVALVFLLLLTILGITAMSTTALEEKMAGNARDRNLAFQSAEAALLAAENWIFTQIQMPSFPNNPNGLYVAAAGAIPAWGNVTWTGTTNLVRYPCTPGVTSGCGSGLSKISTQPKYIIEELTKLKETGGNLGIDTDYRGSGGIVYRVTSRGTGGTDAAQAMVQSTFLRD